MSPLHFFFQCNLWRLSYKLDSGLWDRENRGCGGGGGGGNRAFPPCFPFFLLLTNRNTGKIIHVCIYEWMRNDTFSFFLSLWWWSWWWWFKCKLLLTFFDLIYAVDAVRVSRPYSTFSRNYPRGGNRVPGIIITAGVYIVFRGNRNL